jgi:hypothetical protein
MKQLHLACSSQPVAPCHLFSAVNRLAVAQRAMQPVLSLPDPHSQLAEHLLLRRACLKGGCSMVQQDSKELAEPLVL